MLEPAPEAKVDGDSGQVIFVVDISASMCVTTAVPGVFKMRGKPAQDPGMFATAFTHTIEAVNISNNGCGVSAGFDIPSEDGFVNAPVQAQSNTTWVSRLQCVQAAVDQQIETWK